MDGLDEDPRRKAAMRAKKRREGRSRRESASKDYFWIYVACFYLGAKGLALFGWGSLSLLNRGVAHDVSGFNWFGTIAAPLGFFVLLATFALLKTWRIGYYLGYVLACLSLPVIPIGTACGFMIFTKLPRLKRVYKVA